MFAAMNDVSGLLRTVLIVKFGVKNDVHAI